MIQLLPSHRAWVRCGVGVDAIEGGGVAASPSYGPGQPAVISSTHATSWRRLAHLEQLIALGIGADDRVRGVALILLRLGVESVEVANPPGQPAKRLQAEVAVDVAGVPHDQERAAPVQVGPVALLEGGEHLP